MLWSLLTEVGIDYAETLARPFSYLRVGKRGMGGVLGGHPLKVERPCSPWSRPPCPVPQWSPSLARPDLAVRHGVPERTPE